tara:strand:+ start:49 stop:738 length:690 start_codon:yes stop_codon:yes gene_type:complete
MSKTKCFYNDNNNIIEIGVDEVGRGPMFGRVYTAAVVLPKEGFDYSLMKDSKKFTSKKKITEAANYIKKNALYWSVSYVNEDVIDKINIRQATFKSMHKSISELLIKIKENEENYDSNNIFLLIDGTDFKPYKTFIKDELMVYPHVCIKGGDDKYSNIAAASILAKVTRDQYILDMCEQYPKLKEYYSLDTNKGYGSKVHLEGINTYGVTEWHRKSFGACKNAPIIDIS